MPSINKIIPFTTRRYIKLMLRWSKDLLDGTHKKITTTYGTDNKFHYIKSIEQPITITATSKFKTHNIRLAITKLNNIVIGPDQIFSFWKLVGNPSQKKGYKKSRTIVGNHLQEEVGGGLCQLSGLIYYLAIQTGLTIIERHPHSLDIYTEEERFTPLGSDATVVYGYKDLRFINNYNFPVSLSFKLTDEGLTGIISGPEIPSLCKIEFENKKFSSYTQVITTSSNNGQIKVIASNIYLLLK